MMTKIDRKAAIKTGQRHYFTGLPCKRGHVSHRYTATSNCVQCMIDRIYKKRKEIIAIVKTISAGEQ